MKPELVLGLAQPWLTSFDVEGNVAAHAEAVRSAGARVVVFPEMSLTGYEFAALPLVTDDPRLAPLVDACAATGTLALAGAPVESGDRRSIGMLAVEGDGVRVAYRKQYLGGAEPEHYTPGPGPVVLDVDGWRLGLAICKDTGVPQHAADTAALGIDALLAGVLETREDAGVQPARARRITAAHRIWVAIASYAGSTGGGFDPAAGGSALWAPDGSEVARAGTEPGEVLVVTLADG
ncbi:carbon-nitrogen hydrolase family protein [Cryptosporangium aurantiacum]|uniref:Predicted amidohydrolase n=1 Tax=Cryptosporangium aurantiacum TaxID=134849 RepID=A0A1M7RMD2_9ACTN|nr:carbon-nitrogen hydrolase family protein [Cryptosporangium aurantiacum]SHN47340.1 Predicted amidohydrolase [Cryptosporangium aurantiacum]